MWIQNIMVETLRKTIILDNLEIASVFSDEKFFDQIESRFDATIILRGNSLIVKGKSHEIELIEKIVNELNYLLKKEWRVNSKGYR